MRIANSLGSHMGFMNLMSGSSARRDINKVVQMLNQRTVSRLDGVQKEQRDSVSKALSKIVPKDASDDGLRLSELMKSLALQGGAQDWKNRNDWQGQLKSTYGMLEVMKEYADMVGIYERKAAEHANGSEEEKAYWENALNALKREMDKEFKAQGTSLQKMYGTQLTADKMKESLGLSSFAGMDYKEMVNSLDSAQEALRSAGFSSSANEYQFYAGLIEGKNIDTCYSFEYRVIAGVEGYLEYGDISVLDSEHYVRPKVSAEIEKERKPDFKLSELLGMEPGRWLNMRV